MTFSCLVDFPRTTHVLLRHQDEEHDTTHEIFTVCAQEGTRKYKIVRANNGPFCNSPGPLDRVPQRVELSLAIKNGSTRCFYVL